MHACILALRLILNSIESSTQPPFVRTFCLTAPGLLAARTCATAAPPQLIRRLPMHREVEVVYRFRVQVLTHVVMRMLDMEGMPLHQASAGKRQR